MVSYCGRVTAKSVCVVHVEAGHTHSQAQSLQRLQKVFTSFDGTHGIPLCLTCHCLRVLESRGGCQCGTCEGGAGAGAGEVWKLAGKGLHWARCAANQRAIAKLLQKLVLLFRMLPCWSTADCVCRRKGWRVPHGGQPRARDTLFPRAIAAVSGVRTRVVAHRSSLLACHCAHVV